MKTSHKLADIFRKLLSQLYRIKWNVYCKAPFGSPQHILIIRGSILVMIVDIYVATSHLSHAFSAGV